MKTIESDNIETDQNLLIEVSRGSSHAIWKIWMKYHDQLSNTCRYLLREYPAEADDALSCALVSINQRLPRHAEKIRSLGPWLNRLVRNQCLDQLREIGRKRKRLSSYDNTTEEESICCFENTSDSPEFSYQNEQTIRVLNNAVDQLPLIMKEAFVLRHIYEKGYGEISYGLKITESNARKRVQQARSRLQCIIDKTTIY